MKKIFIILQLVVFSGCAQDNKTKTMSNIHVPEKYNYITANNFVTEIARQVKTYKKNPLYIIRPLQNGCIYEILVNDYPVYKNYSLKKVASPVEINHAILKSGPQTLTYRLYPLGNLMVDEFGKGDTIKTLLKNTSMQIEVLKYEDVISGKGLDDEITVVNHESATLKKEQGFVGQGLPYYEATFTFTAEVPYEIKGWSNGQDFTKLNQELLENKIIEYYKTLGTVMLNENEDMVAKINFRGQLESCIAEYKSEERIVNTWKYLEEIINYEEKQIEALEDYKITFFGNNRLVCLRHPVITPLHHYNQGESAFHYTHEDGDYIKAQYLDVYLYLPKGQPLDSLQML